jgi:hypothetical protein
VFWELSPPKTPRIRECYPQDPELPAPNDQLNNAPTHSNAQVLACAKLSQAGVFLPELGIRIKEHEEICQMTFLAKMGCSLLSIATAKLARINKTPVWLIPLLAIGGFSGCGGGSSPSTSTSPPPSNPIPSITSLSPADASAGGAAFTLTVNGTNFISGSTVDWNGSSRTTTYISLTKITASITAADIAAGETANVTVVNPVPGGGTSHSATFTTNNVVPSVASLSPSLATAGGAAFTLTVHGANFVSTSTIQWNGNNRTTTYISSTQLSTAVTTADIAAGQNAVITVVNPAPGGGASAEVSFPVNTSAPSVLSLSPSSDAAGSGGFVLTVNGSGFLPGSTVQWNGSYGQPPISTTYVSASQLTVAIPASDIAFAGSANVNVLNAAPGGGTSGAAAFTITGSIPSNVSFVAPNGNDSNPGTISEPYLTIQKCATTVSSGSTCAIRAGTYPETVTPNSGITITSNNGEPVTVDGSDPVTGWTVYQGSIYQATVALSSTDSNQIFVGNQMMTEARWPNGNDLFHVNWATAQSGTITSEIVDSNLPNINWTGAKIHLWSGSDPWDPQTGTVTASSQGQLTFNVDGASFPPYIVPTSGGYYYLYRSLDALDTQNEWFYDTSAGILYFWAPGGVNPSTLNVTAKQRQYAFDLSGDSNVTIGNINLLATTINLDSSSANNTLDGINAQYVSQFTDLPDLPGYSYWYDYLSTSGIIINGTGNMLENSTIAYSAGNGVSLIGSNNTIKNNLIQYVDYAANYCAGIAFTFGAGSNNEIEHNTIRGDARYGISYNNGTNEDISYNNVFEAMMVSRDGGEIDASTPQVSGGSAAGTQIHNNWFHDTQSLVAGPADNYPLPGVYLDEDTNGVDIDQNVFWNNQFDNILVNFSNDGITAANNNNVANNTIPDVSSTGNLVTNLNTPCGTTQIMNNLVLVPLLQQGTVCPASNNSSTAPGATQMSSSVQVGCNFSGCSSEGPPAVSGTSVAASIAVQPYKMTVTAGQTVTFTVTGAGSPTLTYQWQRNGANITGATSATYTISATSAADNGAVFAITVSNSLGSVTSNPATLTVD